ncbi:MAG: hypothetical protein AAF587_05005 [Bacteroidota bacterium]
MKRRHFLKSSSLATAGMFSIPYILPSGRLFAQTMNRKVNHVVFCLFAGGVRNMESVHQDLGNLMPAMLEGSPSSLDGLVSVPPPVWNKPLAEEGTLFKEFRYAEGPTGHYNGHTVALTGTYTNTGLNLRANPEAPTIFEYYLKHNSPAVTARNAWWVSNALGPYPALNYSSHASYGPMYGANHIAPTSLFSGTTFPAISNPKQFQFHEEEKIGALRSFLNRNFDKEALASGIGNFNTDEDAAAIQGFIAGIFQKAQTGAYNTPLDLPQNQATNDVLTILFAEEVIQTFTPELLVVNMTDVDICHQNFTGYCNSLQLSDYAVGHLWQTIQNTPGMADDTIMIIVPEHGRNREVNTIQDVYGRYGLDHTGDDSSREIFSIILGPDGIVNKNIVVGTPTSPVGESIDLVPTVANILGFDGDIPSSLLAGRVLEEAFV